MHDVCVFDPSLRPSCPAREHKGSDFERALLNRVSSAGLASSSLSGARLQHFDEQLVHWDFILSVDSPPEAAHCAVRLPQAG